MKVILTQEVQELGKPGAVVEVAPGFARNYLLPRALAVPATEGHLKHQAQIDKARERREAKLVKEYQEMAEKLARKPAVVRVKVGEEGRLYGTVTPKEIETAIKEQFGLEVDRKKFDELEHVKHLGQYPLKIRLYPKVTATLVIDVQEEKS